MIIKHNHKINYLDHFDFLSANILFFFNLNYSFWLSNTLATPLFN